MAGVAAKGGRRRTGHTKMMHPLAGADLATLRRLLAAAGPLSPERAGTVRAIRASAAARAPLSAAERALVAARRGRRGAMPAPLFILGHWRSGTTHLYNLLAATGEFAYPRPFDVGIPWNMLLVAPLLKGPLARSLPADRAIDAIPVTPDSPQEDEFALANMTPLSFLNALYFPAAFDDNLSRGLAFDRSDAAALEHRLAAIETFTFKLFLKYGKQVLIKNPAHTACPDLLRGLFPDARFVHLRRDPYRVAMSMRNYYAKLLPMLALQPFDHVDIDTVVIETYRRMGEAFTRATAGWDTPAFVEVAYDDLDRDPVATIGRIYERLALPGFAAVRPAIERAVAPVKDYRRNVFPDDPAFRARLEAAIGAGVAARP